MKRVYKDIEYTLIRRLRKTGSIYIERDGQVSVLVPDTLSERQIDTLLERKRRWIYRQLAAWRTLNATRIQRAYVNGEGFLYLGRTYRLRLVHDQTVPLLLKDGYFCLRSNNGTTPDADAAFKTFYRRKGVAKISQRVAYYQCKMGVQPQTIRVRQLKHRWASCTLLGTLNFHWKCMMAPLTVLDYIVVHELVHLRHRNHTIAFWHEVDKVLPDYRERWVWLRNHGAGMDL